MAKNDIFTGGGRLYFAEKNADGTFKALKYFGKTDGVTMTTSVEFKEHYDSEGCTPLMDARYPSKVSAEVKFTTSEITLEMQNRAFLGNIVTEQQSAATDDAIVVDAADITSGSIVDVGKYNISVLVVKDATDLITYVEGTHYNFDPKSGYLEIIPIADGGTIVDTVDLHLTATYPDFTKNTSATMKNSSLDGRFELVTSSQTSNNYKYIFKNLAVNLDGDFALKSADDIGSLSFVGAALVDSNLAVGDLSDYIDIIELDSDAC